MCSGTNQSARPTTNGRDTRSRERNRPYHQAAQIKKYLNWEDKSLFGF